MQTNPNQPDEALDKILAALRNAAPPENMQARITQRIQHTASHSPAPSRLRTLLLAFTPTAAWTRGALTGAAFATTILLCALPLLRRSSTPTPAQTVALTTTHPSTPSATNINQPTEHKASFASQTAPCAKPTIAPLPTIQTASSTPRELRAEAHTAAFAPSHPAPALPLTAQERQLVRLVRTVSPAELASLNPELEAKRDAEEAANFQKFFAPPPPTPDSATNPEATRPSAPQLNE